MTHDDLTLVFGHDRTVATYIATEVLSGHRLAAPTGIGPAAQFAADTALLLAQGHAVTDYASEFLTGFEQRLHHRLTIETNALSGDAGAPHRLHIGE